MIYESTKKKEINSFSIDVLNGLKLLQDFF